MVERVMRLEGLADGSVRGTCTACEMWYPACPNAQSKNDQYRWLQDHECKPASGIEKPTGLVSRAAMTEQMYEELAAKYAVTVEEVRALDEERGDAPPPRVMVPISPEGRCRTGGLNEPFGQATSIIPYTP